MIKVKADCCVILCIAVVLVAVVAVVSVLIEVVVVPVSVVAVVVVSVVVVVVVGVSYTKGCNYSFKEIRNDDESRSALMFMKLELEEWNDYEDSKANALSFRHQSWG